MIEIFLVNGSVMLALVNGLDSTLHLHVNRVQITEYGIRGQVMKALES